MRAVCENKCDEEAAALLSKMFKVSRSAARIRIKKVQTKVFDLIVTDLIIPVISGKQIISMIREKSPLFPVVVRGK